MPWRWLLLTLLVASVVLRRRSQGQPIDSRPAWSPFFPLANRIDRSTGWHRLPWPLGLAMVVALRRQLRRDNLHDPSTVVPSLPRPPLMPTGTDHLTARTADGTFNDLSKPEMGSVGTRFGRNVPLVSVISESEAAVLDAQSADCQPGAPDPAHVSARDDAQCVGGVLDPVHDP